MLIIAAIILLCLLMIFKDYIYPSWLPYTLNPITLTIAYHLIFQKYKANGILSLSQDDLVILILYESWKTGSKWVNLRDIYDGYRDRCPHLFIGKVYFVKEETMKYLYKSGY